MFLFQCKNKTIMSFLQMGGGSLYEPPPLLYEIRYERSAAYLEAWSLFRVLHILPVFGLLIFACRAIHICKSFHR